MKKHPTKRGLELEAHVNSEERVARLVRLAAKGFNRALQIRLSEHDISFGQWIFLRILWQQDGITQRELSKLASLTEPTTHTSLLKLEAKGLVRRRNLPGNQRRQHTFLTPEGHSLRHKLEPLAIEVNDIALDGLTTQQQETLRFALLRVIRNLQQDEVEKVSEGRKMPPTRSS